MKSDTNVLKTYMKMILDGRAFNAENKPDEATRKKLVECIIKDKQYQGWLSPKIENRSEVNFQKIKEVEFFKEEEFLV